MTIEVDIDVALAGAGIQAYHGSAPQHAVPPFVVYRSAESEPLLTVHGYASLRRTDFVFEAIGPTWQSALALRDSVASTIRGASGALANHAELPPGENVKEERTDAYIEACAFSIWHS